MVYSWKNYNYPISADEAGKEFEKIEKEYGQVTSELVLKKAEDEESPLHACFEWNNEIAGHKYRLHQATTMIISLYSEPEEVKKPKQIRAYFNVSDSTRSKGSFINAKSAFSNPDTKEIVLKRAMREFKAFREKYENLSEFSQIFELFDGMDTGEETDGEE